MPKTISVLLGGLLAALVALEAESHITWRSGLVAGIAFIGALGIPAIHTAGVPTSSSSAGTAPPFDVLSNQTTPTAPGTDLATQEQTLP
jgi:hypothetical protein